jgi:hypothetical protein
MYSQQIAIEKKVDNFDKDSRKAMQSQHSMIYYNIQRLNKLQWASIRDTYDYKRDR